MHTLYIIEIHRNISERLIGTITSRIQNPRNESKAKSSVTVRCDTGTIVFGAMEGSDPRKACRDLACQHLQGRRK